jgi:tetratricopeptide (TPR) repeat protein
VNENIVQRRASTNAILSQYRNLSEEDFFTWVKTQIDIKSAILIFEENDEDNFMMAASILKSSIDKLKDKYPNELKILGLHMYLSKAYLLLGFYEEALKYAREAARLSPYEPAVRAVLGRVYFEMKDYGKAIHELQICFNIGEPTLEILAKIGKAYFKEGNILHDPDKRKDSFQKATKFFKECHDIIEDKSYEKKDDRYIETLEKTHFNLAYFYWELLNYDDAISYYQITLEMTIARKSTEYILKTLLSLGWVYIEIQSFAEAEKIFKEADCYQDASPLIKIEIAIGLMFSKVERAISFNKNVPFEDTVNDQTVINEDSLKEKANRDRLELNRLTLNKFQKKERIQDLENKKVRLLALYHECKGRYYSKQGKMDEIEKEFEKSISFLPNPRVYLYLAEFYLNEASESRIGRKPLLLAKARNACTLCRKNDLRQQYENELAYLEKKLDSPGK